MKCPRCSLLLDVPSEVNRGTTVGVCSGCGALVGPAAKAMRQPIDRRGAPSKPGPERKVA